MVLVRTKSRTFIAAGFALIFFIAFQGVFRFPKKEVSGLKCSEPGSNRLGAYTLCGFSGIDLMQKTTELRPLFTFTLTPWKVKCSDKKDSNSGIRWSMIVGVKSHSGHFDERARIRKAWKPYHFYNGTQLEYVFAVGRADDWDTNSRLIEENKKYGDLLMVDMVETYKEVGKKAIAAMQWVGDHCPAHWIYASCDDDMGVHFSRLFTHIESLMRNDYTRSNLQATPIECGYSWRKLEFPVREQEERNFVSPEDYPAGLPYPPFCAGGFYSMSVKLSSVIYRVSREHKYFYNDDVWITGLLRLAVIDAGNFPCDDVADLYCAIVPVAFQDVRHLSYFWQRVYYYVEHWSDRIRGVL